MLVCRFSAASSCCDSIAAVEALASLGPESQKHSMSSASVSSEPAAIFLNIISMTWAVYMCIMTFISFLIPRGKC